MGLHPAYYLRVANINQLDPPRLCQIEWNRHLYLRNARPVTGII